MQSHKDVVFLTGTYTTETKLQQLFSLQIQLQVMKYSVQYTKTQPEHKYIGDFDESCWISCEGNLELQID